MVFWLNRIIQQGTKKGKEKRGRQKKRWKDNIKEWTGMDFASIARAGEDKTRWRRIIVKSYVAPQ